MKKFTSLFALLLGLSVYNAQAYTVTVYVYGSYPDNQFMHWWGTEESSAWEAPTQAFDSFNEGTIIIQGDTFYKKVLHSNENESIKIILHDKGTGGQTSRDGIVLTEGEYYFYYFGDNNCYTEFPAVSLALPGTYNNWNTNAQFTRNSMVNRSYQFDISNVSEYAEFKFFISDAWKGWGEVTVNGDVTLSQGNGGNFRLYKSSDKSNKFIVTATWELSNNFNDGWSYRIDRASVEYTVGSNTYYVGESNVLNLGSDDDFTATGNFEVASATYSRSTGENHWGTLCLPFEIKNVPNGATFYSLRSVSATALTFTPISGTIAAGTPVAFKLAEPGTLTINESDVNVVADPLTSGTGLTMKGTFEQKTLSSIYLIYNDEVRPGTNITIPPYRAWFEGTIPSSSGAPLRIEVADTEGLEFVEQEDGTVKAYYDLQGRKLDGARKGLVIENGKIIMVK